ncbi:MAG: hypothetical protein WCI01_10150 [Chlorobiaceae bacterium]
MIITCDRAGLLHAVWDAMVATINREPLPAAISIEPAEGVVMNNIA